MKAGISRRVKLYKSNTPTNLEKFATCALYVIRNKKDAHSATSIYTAKEISLSLSPCNQKKKMADTVGVVQNGVPIHSVRSSGILARQDVVFAQKGETLTLSLSQIDRQAFVPGIIMSVKAVRSLGSGIHVGLECILEKEI